jgi:hypothetical protein
VPELDDWIRRRVRRGGYHALVVHGALEHRLEDAYVHALRATQHKRDPDAERSARHLALLK